jgi:hypothetical protein
VENVAAPTLEIAHRPIFLCARPHMVLSTRLNVVAFGPRAESGRGLPHSQDASRSSKGRSFLGFSGKVRLLEEVFARYLE